MQLVIEIENHNLIRLLQVAEQHENLKFELTAETVGGWDDWNWDVTLPQIGH